MATACQSRWPEGIVNAAAFLVPALALWLPSGYSWGAALLLLGALATWRHWSQQSFSGTTWALAASIVAMGLLWIFLSDPADWSRWDRPLKFLLALPCLLFASHFTARTAFLYMGLLVGCVGAGSIALWQVFGLGLWRANGTTNAIQYGNLAMLLAVLLMVLTSMGLWPKKQSARRQTQRLHLPLTIVSVGAVVLGMVASVLSLSRGGWLALILALPLVLVLLRRSRWLPVLGLATLFSASLSVLAVAKPGMLGERLDRTVNEVVHFEQQGGDSTSVGQRLEHWQLAWRMGLEKPLLGWGHQGYVEEKAQRVAQGEYRQGILGYHQVHNELLDAFVKSGLVGVLALLLFYAVPMAAFWPRAKPSAQADARVPAAAVSAPTTAAQQQTQRLQREKLALQVAGVCVPVMFIGFGLTQVFFAHNSGIMAYLFLVILLWSCLQGVQRSLQSAQG